jgi:hypothetical protein
MGGTTARSVALVVGGGSPGQTIADAPEPVVVLVSYDTKARDPSSW